jgi:hypothetical protein
MAFEPKPNSGVLWPNEKRSSDNQPTMRGDIYLDLNLLKAEWAKAQNGLLKITIAGWNKELAGKSVITMAASAPYVKPIEATPPPSNEFDQSDDVPF